MNTFEKFENRYVFTGTLTLEQDMHIGAGYGDEKVDSLFARSGDKIYIPGSSVRGAMRSHVEQILNSLNKNTCLLFDKKSHETCPTANNEAIKKAKEVAGDSWTLQDEATYLHENLCDTCKIFGSPFFASKIRIADLYKKNISQNPNASENLDDKTHIRFGVGIDRDSETASDGALFEIEALQKNTQFAFELMVENVTDDAEWGPLAIGLLEMMRKDNGGFWIGAKSAAGMGKVQLKIDRINYFDQKDTSYKLQNYLSSGQLGEYKGTADTFLQTKLSAYLKKGGSNVKKID